MEQNWIEGYGRNYNEDWIESSWLPQVWELMKWGHMYDVPYEFEDFLE